MARRKAKARHSDYYIGVFMSLEEAQAADRDGMVSIQNFEHDLTGLDGLEALDAENDFEDGNVLDIPCYIRVFKKQDRKAVRGRKVGVVGGPTAEEATADAKLPL